MLYQWKQHIKQAVEIAADEFCSYAIEKSLPPMGGLERVVADFSGQFAGHLAANLYEHTVAANTKLR